MNGQEIYKIMVEKGYSEDQAAEMLQSLLFLRISKGCKYKRGFSCHHPSERKNVLDCQNEVKIYQSCDPNNCHFREWTKIYPKTEGKSK